MLPLNQYYKNQFNTRDAVCNNMIDNGFILGARVLVKDLNDLAANNPLRELCKGLEDIIIIAEPFVDTSDAITMVVYHEETNTQRAVRAENWSLAL